MCYVTRLAISIYTILALRSLVSKSVKRENQCSGKTNKFVLLSSTVTGTMNFKATDNKLLQVASHYLPVNDNLNALVMRKRALSTLSRIIELQNLVNIIQCGIFLKDHLHGFNNWHTS